MSTHSLEMEASLLLQFKIQLSFFLDTVIDKNKKNKKDIFGNTYFGFNSYDIIEMNISHNYKTISSVRFLGKDKDQKRIRFLLNNIPNIFDPTSLNIISKIRAISDSISDLFNKLDTLFSCRPGSFESDKQLIDQISETASGATGADLTSTISWYEFINTYFFPTPILIESSALTKEQLAEIDKKYSRKIVQNRKRFK